MKGNSGLYLFPKGYHHFSRGESGNIIDFAREYQGLPFVTAKKKTVTKAIVRSLLENGKVSLTGCYSEKTGKTYDCVAVLDDTGGQFVNFTMEFAAKKK